MAGTQGGHERCFNGVIVSIAVVLSASCATSQLVGKNVQRVVAGQPIERSGFSSAMASDTRDLGSGLQQLQHRFNEALAQLKSNVQARWGRADAKTAERTVYVKYTQGYRSRVITDFDHGSLTVETLDENDPKGSLAAAIVSALLASGDPTMVDLFTDKEVTVDTTRRPYLYGLVQDNHGKLIGERRQADRFAQYLLATKLQLRVMKTEQGDHTARFVRVAMVKNFESKSAERYRATAEKYAAQFHVSPSLVLAVMRTESNFNPFAVSSAPAYGLMQLVPSSGGRTALKRAKGVDQAPTPDYLFDADHNIELGAALLGELGDTEYRAVGNPDSRDYCVIAAYNTGAGNVARAFDGDRHDALTSINELAPSALYDRLQAKLPYPETRQYLARVTDNRKLFVGPATGPATAMK